MQPWCLLAFKFILLYIVQAPQPKKNGANHNDLCFTTWTNNQDSLLLMSLLSNFIETITQFIVFILVILNYGKLTFETIMMHSLPNYHTNKYTTFKP